MNEAEKRRIEEIEKEIINEKPWQLKGEVHARARPVNSLLFEDVQFEQTTKAPRITADHTEAIEALIKQRIKDNKFDDPVKKVKPIEITKAGSSSGRQVEVSSEKSKLSIAQIYEQDLLQKVGASNNQPTNGGPEKEVEKRLFALFKKLDALVDR